MIIYQRVNKPDSVVRWEKRWNYEFHNSPNELFYTNITTRIMEEEDV